MGPYNKTSDISLENTTPIENIENKNIVEYSYKSKVVNFLSQLKWFNIILITSIHLIFTWGLFAFPWTQKGKLMLWHLVLGYTSGIGVTAGAHRLWSHRAYKAKLPLRFLLMLMYCVIGHNPIYNWVRDHRVHHKFTDTDADPHNSKRGFFFAHVGWLFVKKHPDVLEKGKDVDMSDVLADPVIQFHQKYYLPLVLCVGFIIPTIIPPLCWGDDWYWSILVTFVGRYCLQLNSTWLVNSAAHAWGTKPYDRSISPTDNRFLSMLTMGECWHNYHHMFPWDYKAAELGQYSANLTTFWIDVFAKFGWAYDLRTPSASLIKKTVLKYGDGTHSLCAY